MSCRMVLKLLVLTFCFLLLAGCGTSSRRKGLQELQALGVYAGVVTHRGSTDSLAIVVLLDEKSGEMIAYSVADPSGRFEIPVSPGDYRLLVWVDLDADFQWDEDEPWAMSDAPAVDVRQSPGDGGRNAITVGARSTAAPPARIDLTYRELPTAEEIRRAALGRVVKADDPMLGPDVGLTSLWQPIEFLKGKNAGVFLLEEFDLAKIPVVMINGIGGSPSEMRAIADRLDRERFQPVFVTYPSGLPIELNGWWLFRLSNEIRARQGFAGDTIFVAHSMGGLVARSTINRLAAAGSPIPLAFISISTPWGGHESSSERGARLAAVPVWADLVPGSTFLRGLYERPLPEELHYYLLFSFSGESALVKGSDDGTVTIPSMLAYEAQDQSRGTFGFAESHTSILQSEKAITTILRILDEESARAGNHVRQ